MLHKTPDQRGDFQVRLIDSLSEFGDIKVAWLSLERSNEQPGFFQSYAWCGHVAEIMTRTYPKSYAPLVAVAARDGEVVAIWPLSRQKRSGLWQLRSLDDPFGQFSGVLAHDPVDVQFLTRETLDIVRNRRLAAAVRMEFVISGSPFEAALSACGASVRGEVGAPYIDVRQTPTFEGLKSSRNKKTMKNLRNANNRLAKAGAHEHRVAIGDERAAEIIKTTLRRRMTWLEDKGLTAPQFRSAAHAEILTGGLPRGLDKARVSFELLCDGKAIAQQWGFLHQKRYYAFMSAVDPSAVHLSPGRLHLAFVIAGAMRFGVVGIELLTPASPYKMVWTDHARRLRDMAMPLSVAGRLHDIVWERTVRPLLKAGFYAMPASLRRHASPKEASNAHAEIE